MNEPNEKPTDEIQPVLQKLGKGIQEEIPPHYKFALMVFHPDDKLGRLNYISNAEREVVLEMLKQFLYRQKAQNEN